MRHQYTPIFRDMLTSSLWALATPATRCVWMTLLLSADPEGYVPASVPGLALASNVSLPECIEALAMLEGPDPHSRTPAHEGRRIQKVDHGWFIYNFTSWRARAVHEAEKARKRTWAHQHRNPANDNAGTVVVDASSGCSETLDAPKPKPKPKSSSPRKGKISAPPPVSDAEPESRGAVFRSLEGWQPTDELRAEATLQGVTDFDERVAYLRTIPIGGQSGVLDRDGYVRAQFPKWRRWAETERAKAQRDAAAPSSRGFAREAGAPPPPERKRVQGAPAWVYEEHARFANNNGLDLPRAAKAYARQAHIAPSSMKPSDVFAPFMTFLENLARAQAVA